MRKLANSEDVAITITKDEAIVLFEMCSRFINHDTKLSSFEVQDEAEWITISAVLALLERALVEPFDDNYAAILAQTKRKLTSND